MKLEMVRFILVFCSLFIYMNRVSADYSNIFQINADLFKVEKNLGKSYVGYDVEDFACGTNFKWILTEGRREFAQKCRMAGVRVWRFAEMSRYSWRGELPTRLMLARKVQHHYKGSESIYRRYAEKQLDWWFDPGLFWSFCRENNILVIPMINMVSYYDSKEKMAYCLVNHPERYNAAADEAAAYLQWLKDNNYIDLAKVWEIGNESFICGWEPEEYAAFVKILVPKLRAIQPDIELAVPIAITTRDNPDMEEILRRFRAGNAPDEKTEWNIYLKVMKWSGKVIEALGDTAREISYGIQHSYGAEPLYNSNIKGLMTSENLLKAFSGSRNWRLVNTEWRDRSGEDGACHRNFKVAALWKAKFVMLMMGFPTMDYTCAHSLFGFSGGLYWSDGNWWTMQSVNRERAFRTRLFDKNGNGKPRFDVGAFGPVARMCNDLIDSHPLLLAHGAELGGESSALYYNHIYFDKEPKTDLQWLVSTNSKRDSIAALIVNTANSPRKIDIKFPQGKADISAAVMTTLSCPDGMEDILQIPGCRRNWQLTTGELFRHKTINVPPQSVNLLIIPVELDKKFIKYTNQIKSDLPVSVKGFSVSNDCKVELKNGAVCVTGEKPETKSTVMVVPCKQIEAENKARNFEVSFKVRNLSGKMKCVPLVIGDKWQKIASLEIIPQKTWTEAKMSFVLPAGQVVKMFRVNIYNLRAEDAVFFKEFVMEQKM